MLAKRAIRRPPNIADLSSFFYYLGLGARSFGGRAAAPLLLLTAEYLADIPGYARHFFRLPFHRIQPPAALVIDDYHELAASNPVHGLLEQALNQAPEGINLIIIGRSSRPRYAHGSTSATSSRASTSMRSDWISPRRGRSPTGAIRSTRALEQLHAHCDGWVAGFTL